jgi:hypothetical protein
LDLKAYLLSSSRRSVLWERGVQKGRIEEAECV